MRVSDILDVETELVASGLCFDSQRCAAGDLFFCLSEDCNKSLRYALSAKKMGAVAIVCGFNMEGLSLPVFVVDDARSALAISAHNFYGRPSEKLTMIGVTGTNGKTTTAYIIKSILECGGVNTGIIGTNEISYCGKHYPPLLTTPDPIDLHRILADMLRGGVSMVVMEVSAHALALRKTEGIVFAVSAFTNLTPDHMDFFSNTENYKKAKKKLFLPKQSKAGVINVDDDMGVELYKNSSLPLITYGCNNPSDIFGIDYKSSCEGSTFVANVLDEIMDVKYCGAGKYNMYNVLCALGVARVLGIETEAMRKGIEDIKGIEGRINLHHKNGKTVVVDYAHTPDGLANIIQTVREFTRGKVIIVFGCGGQRDTQKRAVMGEIASEMSDFAVVTSDNPRNERPMSIIADIVSGIKGANYAIEEDRYIAIKSAIEMAHEEDIVIVAGKGHECTQEIDGAKIAFSDTLAVKEILK